MLWSVSFASTFLLILMIIEQSVERRYDFYILQHKDHAYPPLQKAPILLVDKISNKKIEKKGSNKKKKMKPKASISKKKTKSVSAKGTCFHCGNDGYWKRNCKHYFASLKQKEASVAKGLYMIQTNLSLSTSTSDFWILDSICDHTFANHCRICRK